LKDFQSIQSILHVKLSLEEDSQTQDDTGALEDTRGRQTHVCETMFMCFLGK